MKLMRDLETHRKNTWLWSEWGFTDNLPQGLITLTDVDGFFCHFSESNYQFLFIEMKHWDGIGNCPKINRASGQGVALWRLAQQKNFTVLIGYGDTSTRTIYECEIWYNGKTSVTNDFQAAYEKWYKWANEK